MPLVNYHFHLSTISITSFEVGFSHKVRLPVLIVNSESKNQNGLVDRVRLVGPVNCLLIS